MRVTFEPERGPTEPLEEERLVLLEDRELRVLAHARLHPLHRRHRGLAQPQRMRRAGRELPQPHARCGCAARRRARAARRRRARRRSGAPSTAGRPARRPISAAVCTVRVGVKVSSTRTSRSVTESPEGEFAMLHPDTTPIGWECRARGTPNGGAWQEPHRSMSKETPMTSVESDRADRRRSLPRSCSSRLPPHPRACSPRPTSCRRPRSRRRSSTPRRRRRP